LSRIDRGTDAKVDRARTRRSPAGTSRRTSSHLSRLLAGNSRRNVAFLASIFALGGAAVAVAAPTGTAVGDNPAAPGNPSLAQVGPVAKNGFPAWYKDQNGTRLEACLDNQDPLCAAVFGALPNPDAPSTPDDVTGNFPDEFFYQAASAGLANIGAPDAQGKLGKAGLDASLEGAFAAGAPKPGDQMVFARLRLRVTAGLRGDTNYLFVHPYGERTIKTDPGTDNLFVTEDIGTAAGVFTDALKGRVAPFLKWDPSVDPQAPEGYTGDPAIGHPITGGVNDVFAIVGPGVGANKLNDGTDTCGPAVLAKANNAPGGAIQGTGPGGAITEADCVGTNLFSLLGKLAQNAGVDVKRATFSRDTDGNTAVDVQAESDGGQTIVVRPTANRTSAARLFSPTKLAEDHGRYYAHVTMDSSKGFPNGSENQVQLINATDGSPQDSKDVTPVDEILKATATWDNTPDADGNGTLTVAAQSSDQFGADNVALSVDDPDGGQPAPIGANGQGMLTLPAAPRTVTITSSKGGTLTIPVHSDMTKPATPAPLTADAGRPVKAATGASVKLFGTGSTGPIASYAWTGPFAVTNGTVDTGTPSTANGGAITAGADTDTATLTAPSAAGQYGYQLEVTGDDGSKAAATTIVTVNDGGAAPGAGTGDPLTPGKVRYTQSQGRMVVDGTATVTTAHKIRIWFANHIPADPFNTKPDAVADVAIDGSWAFDTGRGGMPNPPNADCVSYISDLGAPGAGHVGNNTTLAPADEWDCLPIDGRNLTAPLPPAPDPPGGAVAAAAGLRAAAVPGLGAAVAPAALRAARVAAPATVTAAAVATTGVPVTVTVPAGATLVRLRLLTTANKALLTTFKKAKGGTKIKVKLRSATLRNQLHKGNRFIVEARAGTAKNRLGRPSRKVVRVRG
jgi:hypothetical protein